MLEVLHVLTEVAREPVLHTVNKFNPADVSPPSSVFFISHSAPCLLIVLFLPKSSSATACASLMRASASTFASNPDFTPSSTRRVSLRVAAPRFTAVGLAVKR